MSEPELPDITRMLEKVTSGDAHAAHELLPLVYEQLRAAAQKQMAQERGDHTLQATALVHEAFVRLVDVKVAGESRGQFIALAARAMRSILVDHARTKGRVKRGGDAVRVTLDEGVAIGGPLDGLIEIYQALTRLAEIDARKADIVELHTFGGLTYAEIAGVLKISESTVRADMRFSKAWLKAALAH